ncbi:unnamed protein product [Amoebophrya sp. A120]|nr:unnamed protein product [Amoebophrya sp. A120]|eukprot:GSA120T00000701001.1
MRLLLRVAAAAGCTVGAVNASSSASSGARGGPANAQEDEAPPAGAPPVNKKKQTTLLHWQQVYGFQQFLEKELNPSQWSGPGVYNYLTNAFGTTLDSQLHLRAREQIKPQFRKLTPGAANWSEKEFGSNAKWTFGDAVLELTEVDRILRNAKEHVPDGQAAKFLSEVVSAPLKKASLPDILLKAMVTFAFELAEDSPIADLFFAFQSNGGARNTHVVMARPVCAGFDPKSIEQAMKLKPEATSPTATATLDKTFPALVVFDKTGFDTEKAKLQLLSPADAVNVIRLCSIWAFQNQIWLTKIEGKASGVKRFGKKGLTSDLFVADVLGDEKIYRTGKKLYDIVLQDGGKHAKNMMDEFTPLMQNAYCPAKTGTATVNPGEDEVAEDNPVVKNAQLKEAELYGNFAKEKVGKVLKDFDKDLYKTIQTVHDIPVGVKLNLKHRPGGLVQKYRTIAKEIQPLQILKRATILTAGAMTLPPVLVAANLVLMYAMTLCAIMAPPMAAMSFREIMDKAISPAAQRLVDAIPFNVAPYSLGKVVRPVVKHGAAFLTGQEPAAAGPSEIADGGANRVLVDHLPSSIDIPYVRERAGHYMNQMQELATNHCYAFTEDPKAYLASTGSSLANYSAPVLQSLQGFATLQFLMPPTEGDVPSMTSSTQGYDTDSAAAIASAVSGGPMSARLLVDQVLSLPGDAASAVYNGVITGTHDSFMLGLEQDALNYIQDQVPFKAILWGSYTYLALVITKYIGVQWIMQLRSKKDGRDKLLEKIKFGNKVVQEKKEKKEEFDKAMQDAIKTVTGMRTAGLKEGEKLLVMRGLKILQPAASGSRSSSFIGSSRKAVQLNAGNVATVVGMPAENKVGDTLTNSQGLRREAYTLLVTTPAVKGKKDVEPVAVSVAKADLEALIAGHGLQRLHGTA